MILKYAKMHLFGIDMIFTDFKNYQTLIEDFLESKKKELQTEFDETDLMILAQTAKGNEREYYLHLMNSYAERHQEISRLFPHNFRASFLIQIISFIEFELKEISNYCASENNQLFEMKDLHGSSDFEKAKIYLKKVGNVDFEKLEPEWKFIDNCRLLRNRLTHNQGQILNNDRELNKFIESCESITLTQPTIPDSNYKTVIIKDKQLIDDLLKNTMTFFQKLLFEELKYSS